MFPKIQIRTQAKIEFASSIVNKKTKSKNQYFKTSN